MKEKKKQIRKYDAHFKEQAVNQVLSGRSVPSVAKALGISDVVLYTWTKKASINEGKEGNNEIDNLLKQIKQLETERDILKKALAIFSRVN